NNNQWAISVPVAKQTASATLAQKAPAYGFDGVRVDGMDALAVFRATGDAARRAREGHGPTMIEAVTYRLGPHSSSDDPSRYRDESEVALWRARDPIARYRRYLEHAGWWDDGREARLEQEIGDEITRAIQEAESAPPPAEASPAALPSGWGRTATAPRRRGSTACSATRTPTTRRAGTASGTTCTTRAISTVRSRRSSTLSGWSRRGRARTST